jgi:alkanesulfonate monooxygenase SsuD/methylene tetrahydromethanopterin reductase-like flavin-dependent oxidoreductase (luciferase family)
MSQRGMNLGLFLQPVHRSEKPWAIALQEDRETVLLAERLGLCEVWIGEHFSTRAEQIPSPLMFLATLIQETSSIRFGTGVINLPFHDPVIVAAEVAQFDQLSGGRVMFGIGPGGLMSDVELFGNREMPERYRIALESLDLILKLWQEDAPLHWDGEYFGRALERRVWLNHGVGQFARPLQQPHPPIAMAMVGPGGRTAETIAERDMIPISANFVPIENVAAQWRDYALAREQAGKVADRHVWRVCRNILVTQTDEEAAELLLDPDGVIAHYFRYIRGVRRIEEFQSLQREALPVINEFLEVPAALEDCAIVGSADTVLARLVDLVDQLGPFGTLVMVGHDWEASGVSQRSMQCLAENIMPQLKQYADSLGPARWLGL